MKKLKTLFLAAICSLSISGAFAQEASLNVGELQLNAGIGFSNWGVPIYAGLEYGIHEDITIGGELSYRKKTDNSVDYTSFGIIANGNYHFNRVLNIPSEFDFYAGVSIGYFNWSVDNLPVGGSATYSSGINSYLQVGGRYFFDEKWGVNLEFGGGNISGAKIGITYKF